MSQLNIDMKKNSMRKNKRLVINIATVKKEGLASRSEADQDLGASIKNEKKRFESSKRPRDVFDQRVCSKADEETDRHGSHSSVRDGVMREVDVGTGLCGALRLLREQGTFKEKSSSSNKRVGVTRDDHGKDDRFKDAFNDIRIDRVDEFGRVLTEKEAFKKLCHGFHGKKPGKRKQEKRMKKHEESSKYILETSDRAVERMRQVHAELKRKQNPCIPTRARLETVPPSSTRTQLCSENLRIS